MKRITLRNVPEQLSQRLAKLAETRGQSVNTMILELLESATENEARRARLAYYTTWTHTDVEDFDEALSRQRTIDGT